jgi:hypothetical protein
MFVFLPMSPSGYSVPTAAVVQRQAWFDFPAVLREQVNGLASHQLFLR